MIALGPEAFCYYLSVLMQKIQNSICKEIGNFPIVDQELKDCVLDEFSGIIESSVNSNLGRVTICPKTS